MSRTDHADSERWTEVSRLHRERPQSRTLQLSLLALVSLALYAWSSGELATSEFFSARRLANLQRFLREELLPHELQGRSASLGSYLAWARARWTEHGASALLATLEIATLAILLAGLGSWLLAPLTARNIASAAPFGQRQPGVSAARVLAFGLVRWSARASAILLRATPEYVLAFLLLAILGPGTAWPAVLALALHNGGILTRLTGESIENLEPAPLRSLASLGASRRQVTLLAVLPLALGRFLLYFFYRFETCVREATVLGMLGVVSLGYWIQDARTRQFYDRMIFLVALGVLLVLLADLLSALARRYLRSR